MADEVRASTDAPASRQFVRFALAGERYGVAVTAVQEIIRHTELTHVPRAAAFVDGVLNLRGRVIPVVNLRRRFGLPEAAATPATRIIVVEADGAATGITVDAVSEVIQLQPSEIESPPPLAKTIRADFLLGMGKVGDGILILLDIGRVLADGDATPAAV